MSTAPQAFNEELDQLLKLFFQLLDLSLDVERNREDHAFHQEGRTISYVLDENLLELFIDPRDSRGRMISLHAPEWSRSRRASAAHRSVVAETALATAEYLISGELPGQRRRALFMTEWHRWEFTRRVEELQVQQIRRLRRATPEEFRERFAGVRETLAVFEQRPDDIELHLANRRLAADLEAFRARGPTREALKAYLATRLALELLANDELLEPSQQLRRLVTPPLRHVFTTLHRALPPATAEEKRAIAEDAREWMRRLRDECARREIDVIARDEAEGVGRRRSEGALWDDAKSLALVRWAAAGQSRSSLDQRLVFVTADQLVFDVYRRWYADLPFRDPAYSEPFCLRRITQFAPVFNLLSSGRVEGEAYLELFKDLLQTLEVMLLPLNLSRIASRAPSDILGRMRERTALRPTEPGRIADDPAYRPLVAALQHGGVSRYRAELDNIIDRWRELERAALGRPDEQIQHRIGAAEAIEAGFDPDVSAEAFERYVTELVQTLLSGSRKLSLPLAREFIDHWPAPANQEVTRAPIALQLTVTTPGRSFAVGELLDRRLAGGETEPLLDEEGWNALYEQPSVVFSIATAQCLATRDWSNAQHFAEMALLEELEEGARSDGPAGQDQGAEIKYLYALVTRFRMGEIGPPLTGDAFTRLSRYYRLALQHLDECEAYHSQAGSRQELRVMRALSERAALHLFFISSTNRWVRLAAAKRRSRHRVAEADLLELNCTPTALEALEAAETDLAACLALDAALPPIAEPYRLEFRAKLQRQYYTNIAAVGVFRALWGQPGGAAPPALRPGAGPAEERARDVLDRYGAATHPLMRADVLGFLALGGDVEAAEELRTLPRLERTPGVLNLDVAIIDAIRDRADDLIEMGCALVAEPLVEPARS
jgi:hypothetical protein